MGRDEPVVTDPDQLLRCRLAVVVAPAVVAPVFFVAVVFFAVVLLVALPAARCLVRSRTWIMDASLRVSR